MTTSSTSNIKIKLKAALARNIAPRIERREQQGVETMIFPFGLKQLRQPQGAGEQERQPEQRRRHRGDLVRRQIEGEVKDEQQQRAEKKHRQQAVAPAQLEKQVLPQQ